MVVTFSKLDGVRKAYSKSHLSSKSDYDRFVSEGRLHYLDGPGVFDLLQRLYRQKHLLPNDIALSCVGSWLQVDSVRLGIVKGSELVALYKRHGESLFFENIRDFLGVTSGKKVEDRETVNQEIIKTITTSPSRMLERNNGITFRAIQVQQANGKTITLQQGAIVNGCQTTMCLVHSEQNSPECLVQVKVVETPDAWDIAKAANYQNQVARIELDLAKYLRPQLVQKVATDLGVGVSTRPDSATALLDEIYQERIDYDEMKCLYLGFFSRKPNNLFEGNYTELRSDVLEVLYQEAQYEYDAFAALFAILNATRRALDEYAQTFSNTEYAALFQRFFQDDKPRYRAFLAVLAICGGTRQNLAEREPDARREAERMKSVLKKIREILENNPDQYKSAVMLAFRILADIAVEGAPSGQESEIAQMMFGKISKAPFNGLYMKLLVHIDTESMLKK
jgi:hypothetical protein